MPGVTLDREETRLGERAEEPVLLTPEEVARRLRVTRRTIYAWLKIGRLRGLRAGKGWRIRSEDLEAFLMPPAEWEQRLDASLARTREQAVTEIPEAELLADLEAVRNEIYQEHHPGRC